MKKASFKFAVASGLLAVGLSSTASAAVVFIDFTSGSTATAATAGNKYNVIGNGSSATILTLADETGGATTIQLSIPTTGVGGAASPAGSTGLTAMSAATNAGFTDAAAASYHFSSGLAIITYTFSGLDATGNTSYAFTAFGSRNQPDTRPTQFTVATTGVTSQQLTAAPSGPVNNSAVQAFNGIATTSGTITFSVQGLNTTGNQFGYLNMLRLDTAAVPEPSSAMLLGSLGLLGLLRRRRA